MIQTLKHTILPLCSTEDEVKEAHLWIKVWALDHKNRTASNSIRMWHTRVRRWYSSNSKRTQTAVALPSAPAEIFLFLHNNISAVAKYYHKKQSHKILSDCNFISHSIKPLTIADNSPFNDTSSNNSSILDLTSQFSPMQP